MGQEATGLAVIDGEEAAGKVLLETDELVFRGPPRLAVRLAELDAVEADGGWLRVSFSGRRAEFEVGAAAPRWADRILNPPTRLDKMGVTPGADVVLLGRRDKSFTEELAKRGATVTNRIGAGAQLVILGAEKAKDPARLEGLARSLAPDGALWVVYPKGKTGISEGEVLAAGRRAGLTDVKVARFSDSHTALKFVIPRAKR